MKAKITKRLVDSLDASQSETLVNDTELEGFGLRVRPPASRVYVLRYRFGGERKRKTIGPHGSPWTPETARKEARRLLGLVATGIDPLFEEQQAKKEMTIKALCETYLAQAEAGHILTNRDRPKKPATIAKDRASINGHIVPLLGNKKISALTRPDVVTFRNNVTAGKTSSNKKTGKHGRSIIKGGPSAARRSLATLSAVYSHAVSMGLVQVNPVHGIVKKPAPKNKQTLTAENYQVLHEALATVEEASKTRKANTGTKIALAAIRLLLLTGCRRNEVLSLLKTEIDAKTGCFRFADTKTGAQVRPIGVTAIQFAVTQDWNEKSDYVFPASRGEGHLVNVQRTWNEVRIAASLDDVPLHTARHGFASVAAELGYSLPTIGGLLGHSSGSVTSQYIHLVDSALVAAANQVAAVIDARMKGEKEEQDNVVTLHGAG